MIIFIHPSLWKTNSDSLKMIFYGLRDLYAVGLFVCLCECMFVNYVCQHLANGISVDIVLPQFFPIRLSSSILQPSLSVIYL